MEGFIGEIMLFGGNFAPRNWAFCEGQLLPIAQNTALFSILGTTYGGDGRTTFGLPDLRGRVAIHEGRGPGLTDRQLGQKGGSRTVALSMENLPLHNHTAPSVVNSDMPGANFPANSYIADGQEIFAEGGTLVDMGEPTTGNAGGGQPHINVQPIQTLKFVICLVGVYPSRS